MNLQTKGLSSTDFADLRSAIDESVIIAITDKNGVITYVNDKFCKISKFSIEELLGKTHKVVNSGQHSREFFNEMWETISSGKTWEGEVCNRAKDGSYYWVHTTIVPFLDTNGQPEKYVSVRYEVTERKLGEQKLRFYAKELEVNNKELQNFAYVAAHDLQEPLRKIQSFSNRLQVKAEGDLKPDALDSLARLQNSATRMQVLINDLLSYSRVTTKAQPFEKVDLNEIVSQVMSDLEIRLEQSQGVVKWEKLPIIEADATQMRQLFQNLIGNSLKFTKPNQPARVHIHSQIQPKILNELDKDSKNLFYQIRVQDNGIGFKEQYLDRIFTIFQRLHGRHEYEGTGVGLAICRKILERHEGQITATSQEGVGSTFIVTLPEKQS